MKKVVDERTEALWSAAMTANETGPSYEAFLEAFSKVARRIILWKTRQMNIPASAVEDILQEVLIAVHTQRHKWNSSKPLCPWLYAIIKYKTVDYCRTHYRHTTLSTTWDESFTSMHYFSSDDDTLDDMEDLRRSIDKLPEVHQELIHAIGLEESSYKEEAERRGIREGTLRVMFHRSLKALKKLHEK